MLCKRYSFRRRHAIRLLLIGFMAYLGYVSLATLGYFAGIREPGVISSAQTDRPLAPNDQHQFRPAPVEIEHEAHVVESVEHVVSKHRETELYVKKSYAAYDNMADYAKIELNGANGKGMKIDGKDLVGEEKKKYDDGWQNYAFNHYISTLMPVNRSLPDVRLAG